MTSPSEASQPIHQHLKALERENRILQKKLSRSEHTRAELELLSQRRELMLKQLVREAEIAKSELEKAKEAADSANRAKSEFLAKMSHELRTPLNGILGYAQILQRTESLSEKGKKGVGIVHQCGEHLLNLINDVLDISKIEARKLELCPENVHLPSFMQSVVEICRVRAEQKGIAFIAEMDDGLPSGITVDAKRLRQVLINLLGNAIKFTDKGHVTFRVWSTNHASNESQSCLYFTVEDTGVGLTPKQIEKICLPFEQVGEKSRKQGGTGLGLAISTQILQMMGSQLSIDSQMGMGSTFSFTLELPTTRSWHASFVGRENRQITGYQGDHKTILVVDDRWENRSVVANLLEPLGFEIIEAEDGQQGWKQAQQIRPDLIITDLVMPVIDGFELLHRLRQDVTLQTVPTIASSASVFEEDRYKSLDAGAHGFLPKPLQADQLLDVLQKHLQVKWLYEAPVQSEDVVHPSDPSDPLTPPLETLKQLNTCLRKGDLDSLVQIAQQLDTPYQEFTHTVVAMAEGFQIKPLKGFLAETMQDIMQTSS